jgi:LacI family transcriptional regulator
MVRIGIRQIAAEVGVSVATVSRVLNGQANVDVRLREQVLAVAERLGYRPNGVARSLRLRATRAIGVVIPTIINPYFTTAFCAMQDAAAERGYVLLLGNADRDVVKEEAELMALMDRQVDGVVLVSGLVEPSATVLQMLQWGVPVVAMERIVQGLPVDHVIVDARGGMRLAVEHLAERGRRRIAFIANPPGIWTGETKRAGYHDGLEAVGLPFDPALVVPGGNDPIDGERAAEAMLALSPRPDAVIIGNQQMGLGALRAIIRHGVRIPDDLAIVGSDAAWADIVRPALTVITQPSGAIGRRAVELLLERIADPGAERPPVLEVIPAGLIVRDST